MDIIKNLSTIEKWLKKEPLYLGLFTCKEDLIEEFELDPNELDGVNILIAFYEIEWYEGQALVIYEEGGFLYEVYGSHCSCYGLERQWQPELSNVIAIENFVRLQEGVWKNPAITKFFTDDTE